MKTLLVFFVATVLHEFAFAADITLTGGRVLKDATVMSQTPRTVIVKHAAGLSSVAKELLPLELQARYPVDEAAAQIADERAARALEALRDAEQAETERRTKYFAQTDDPATEQVTAEKTQAAEVEQRKVEQQADGNRIKARRLVERYFEERYCVGSETTNCSATVAEFRPLNGRSGPWFLAGTATVAISYWSTPVDDSIPQVGVNGIRPPDAVVTRDFEAIFTADSPDPKISVSVR